jgi:hypothetical protein
MKAAFKTLLAVTMAMAVVVVVNAEDQKGKSVTLKGELGCAKCVFEVQGIKKCTNAIKVKEKDSEVVYIIDDKGAKEKYHGKICKATKKGSVTGVVSTKGKQKHIKPDKDGVKFED